MTPGSLWWIDVELLFSARMSEAFWQRLRRMHTKCHPELLSGVEWVLLRNFTRGTSGSILRPVSF